MPAQPETSASETAAEPAVQGFGARASRETAAQGPELAGADEGDLAGELPGEFTGLEEDLAEQLPAFELFFKTFGFKRVHGRVWGLLVLCDRALSSKEVGAALGISTGLTSTTINELTEWGALRSTFDPSRRCHLHEPVGNTMSIVATILRRREQVAMARFRSAANEALRVIKKKHGATDPRVLTLRSIIGSCDIAEAVMQLVMSSVERALGDSQSLLSKALTTALKLSSALPGLGRGRARVQEGDGDLPAAIEAFIAEESAAVEAREEAERA